MDTKLEAVKEKREMLQCYHCGQAIEEEHLQFDDKDFCCRGCQTVYEILNENDLCGYYDLESNPGIQLKSRQFDGKFDFLDRPELKAPLLDFASEQLEKIRIYLPAIHCSSCIWLLENLAKLKEGILSSRVNFLKKTLHLDYDPRQVSLKEIAELLSTIGYAPDFSLKQTEKKTKKGSSEALPLRIGVAGFAFGNIMLLSFPEYFGFEGLSDEGIRQFISYFNFFLALPVVFYCAIPYYQSAFKALRKRFINIDFPIVLGIAALFFRSSYEVLSQSGAGYFDSLAGLLFFLLVGRWFQSRTYESMSFERDYKSYFPIAVQKEEAGKNIPTAIKALRPGDRIIIRSGELIPADSRLLEGDARIDYSFVSGEQEPIRIDAGALIYAGGRQSGGQLRLEVVKDVSQSYLTSLWNASENDQGSRHEALVQKISRHFTVVILSIAFLSLAYWLWADSTKALNAFSAVLIVACPCALSMATPFTLGNTMRVFGRLGFFLKNTAVVEKMAKINTLVFDKTGTITQTDKTSIHYEGEVLSEEERRWIHHISVQSTHPLSRQVASYLKDQKHSFKSGFEFLELPGKGIIAQAPGWSVRLGSYRFFQEEGLELPPLKEQKVTTSEVWVAINDRVKGRFLIKAAFRPYVAETLKSLARRFQLHLISGDSDAQREELQPFFPEGTQMLFRQKPGEKESFIKTLQEAGAHVAMIGDGLNDGIALRRAHVGIAISDDVSAFAPASDAILEGKALPYLPQLFSFSHFARQIIIAAFAISFLYNIVGLAFAVTGNLSPIFAAVLMPLSSITVVSFTTGSILLKAKWEGLWRNDLKSR
jgi:Cu+-exporting ATPase